MAHNPEGIAWDEHYVFACPYECGFETRHGRAMDDHLYNSDHGQETDEAPELSCGERLPDGAYCSFAGDGAAIEAHWYAEHGLNGPQNIQTTSHYPVWR